MAIDWLAIFFLVTIPALFLLCVVMLLAIFKQHKSMNAAKVQKAHESQKPTNKFDSALSAAESGSRDVTRKSSIAPSINVPIELASPMSAKVFASLRILKLIEERNEASAEANVLTEAAHRRLPESPVSVLVRGIDGEDADDAASGSLSIVSRDVSPLNNVDSATAKTSTLAGFESASSDVDSAASSFESMAMSPVLEPATEESDSRDVSENAFKRLSDFDNEELDNEPAQQTGRMLENINEEADSVAESVSSLRSKNSALLTRIASAEKNERSPAREVAPTATEARAEASPPTLSPFKRLSDFDELSSMQRPHTLFDNEEKGANASAIVDSKETFAREQGREEEAPLDAAQSPRASVANEREFSPERAAAAADEVPDSPARSEGSAQEATLSPQLLDDEAGEARAVDSPAPAAVENEAEVEGAPKKSLFSRFKGAFSGFNGKAAEVESDVKQKVAEGVASSNASVEKIAERVNDVRNEHEQLVGIDIAQKSAELDKIDDTAIEEPEDTIDGASIKEPSEAELVARDIEQDADISDVEYAVEEVDPIREADQLVDVVETHGNEAASEFQREVAKAVAETEDDLSDVIENYEDEAARESEAEQVVKSFEEERTVFDNEQDQIMEQVSDTESVAVSQNGQNEEAPRAAHDTDDVSVDIDAHEATSPLEDETRDAQLASELAERAEDTTQRFPDSPAREESEEALADSSVVEALPASPEPEDADASVVEIGDISEIIEGVPDAEDVGARVAPTKRSSLLRDYVFARTGDAAVADESMISSAIRGTDETSSVTLDKLQMAIGDVSAIMAPRELEDLSMSVDPEIAMAHTADASVDNDGDDDVVVAKEVAVDDTELADDASSEDVGAVLSRYAARADAPDASDSPLSPLESDFEIQAVEGDVDADDSANEEKTPEAPGRAPAAPAVGASGGMRGLLKTLTASPRALFGRGGTSVEMPDSPASNTSDAVRK